MSKLIILQGPPCSGKSTWAKNWITTHGVGVIISRDAVRFALLEDEDDYFSRENEVYNEYIRWAQDKLNDDSCPGPVILDATHLDKRSRGKVLNSLKLDNVDEIHVFYFDISLINPFLYANNSFLRSLIFSVMITPLSVSLTNILFEFISTISVDNSCIYFSSSRN